MLQCHDIVHVSILIMIDARFHHGYRLHTMSRPRASLHGIVHDIVPGARLAVRRRNCGRPVQGAFGWPLNAPHRPVGKGGAPQAPAPAGKRRAPRIGFGSVTVNVGAFKFITAAGHRLSVLEVGAVIALGR